MRRRWCRRSTLQRRAARICSSRPKWLASLTAIARALRRLWLQSRRTSFWRRCGRLKKRKGGGGREDSPGGRTKAANGGGKEGRAGRAMGIAERERRRCSGGRENLGGKGGESQIGRAQV